jgi:hypothetical protein
VAGHPLALDRRVERYGRRAAAVLDYVCLLAEAGTYAMIDVPTTAGDCGATTARLLLGPSLPIATESIQGPVVELIDDIALGGLRDPAQRLRSPTTDRADVDGRELRLVDEYDVQL